MRSWILRSVRDVLSVKGSQVWAISADATVGDALRLMAEKRVGAVLVTDGSHPVGMLSERDFARSAINEQRALRDIRVRELMSTEVIFISPDKTVEDCMEIMTNRRVRHLPVVDGGRIVGLVSIGDVVKWIITEQVEFIDDLERYIAGPNITA